MDLLTVLTAAGVLGGSFILPIRWLFNGQNKMKGEISVIERRSVPRSDMERMITLYTDPIKEDVHATKKGVDGLIEKFHRLELLIAREFGKNTHEVKQKEL